VLRYHVVVHLEVDSGVFMLAAAYTEFWGDFILRAMYKFVCSSMQARNENQISLKAESSTQLSTFPL
jgi:hypothetical protein